MLVAVIDDNVDTSHLVVAMLRQMHCRTCAFTDPQSAFTAIPPQVELVLSDVAMQGMDGLAVAERVAEHLPSTCATPQYAACPYYDTVCGRTFRLWIAQREADLLPSMHSPSP